MKARPRTYRNGALVVALLAVTGFAACELNPQPLPPQDNAADSVLDSGFATSGDARASMLDDSGSSAEPSDGGADARDAGDAGDAGDADAQ